MACSYNEWDPLEEVIVGDCRNAGSMSTKTDPVLKNLIGHCNQFVGYGTAFDKMVVDKAALELDNLARVLEGEGITVKRPIVENYTESVVTPDWAVPVQNSAACPRDTLIVFGNVKEKKQERNRKRKAKKNKTRREKKNFLLFLTFFLGRKL